MNRPRKLIGLIASLSGLFAFAQNAFAQVDPKMAEEPRTNGIKLISEDPGEFALRTFFYANWPAVPGKRGEVDLKRQWGTNAPAVWETMKNGTEIYRTKAAEPCPWETVCELPDGTNPPTTEQLRQKYGATNSNWLHFLSENRMIDGQQIVDSQSAVIRYDVRCNRDHFHYVVKNPSGFELYSIEGQQKAWADDKFTFDFPASAMEFKAAWRILDPKEDDSRYWTAYGAFYDENQTIQYAKIGLTALHISSHIQPNWVWLTYEQVDNSTATYQYFLQTQERKVGPNLTIDTNALKYNDRLKSMSQGTKWQFYQIIGWQVDETDAQGKPIVLANSNIETYFPKTSSCMSCHAMANIGPPENRRLNMWLTDSNGIQGRIGAVDFQDIAKQLAPGQKFKQMNYVWSLRQAQSRLAGKKQSNQQ